MNKQMKNVVLVWLFLILLIILFPPYSFTFDVIENGGIKNTVRVSYGFIFSSPPKPERYQEYLEDVKLADSYIGTTMAKRYETYDGISILRMFLEILVATIACLFAFYYFKFYNPIRATNK